MVVGNLTGWVEMTSFPPECLKQIIINGIKVNDKFDKKYYTFRVPLVDFINPLKFQ